MINHREPTVSDIIEILVGVSFKSECTNESVTQNAFYWGYDCDSTVNNVFAYAPDGQVFLCTESFWELDGQFFDSEISSTYKKRIVNYNIYMDKGFLLSGLAFNIFARSYNQCVAWQLHPHIHD